MRLSGWEWAVVAVLSAIPFALVQGLPASLYWVLDTAPYLAFHNVAELFSVVVSLSVFGLGWFSYRRSRDGHALFLSMAFLSIGLLDLLHTLGYNGMPAFFTPNTANKSTQFWIAARLFTATALLASAFIPAAYHGRWLSRASLMTIALSVPTLVFVLVTFFPAWVPPTFDPVTGLTPFKRGAEVVVILLLGLAFLTYFRRRSQYPTARHYLAAFVLCVFSELSFTVYQNVFDTYNVIGHLYKIAAFSLIYLGIFASSIAQPYDRLQDSLNAKENLLRELFHRTKNTLQMVRGMLVLQAGEYPEDNNLRQVVTKTEDRIQVVSLVHDTLFEAGDLSRISLKAYIEQLAALLFRGSGRPGIAVRLELADEPALIDTAIPLGLTLNELVTNSLKYAFPDGRGGTITIRLEKTAPGALRLSYSDDGVGVPPHWDWRAQESLGLQLIQSLTEGQMRGTLQIIGNPGFLCTVDFPLDLYRARV